MQVRRVISSSMGILLALEATLSLTSITLLSRALPASEEAHRNILEANRAVDDMVIELASTSSTAERRERFLAALARAEDGFTGPHQRALLSTIRIEVPYNFSDEVREERRDQLLAALRALPTSSQELLEEADLRARRIGQAGAWASVIVGLLALLITLVLWRRINGQVVHPLTMVRDVVESAVEGDPHRRCTVHGARALADLAGRLNEILDRLNPREPRRNLARLDRALLLHLLDAREKPAMAVAVSGEVVVANQAALRLLEDDQAGRMLDEIRRAVAGQEPASRFEITEVSGGELWLVEAQSVEPVADPSLL